MAVPSGDQKLLGQAIEDLQSTISQAVRTPVPGDSPAFYNGDPSNDVLSITKLHLIVNPPDRFGEITFGLWGVLKSSPGTDSRYKLSLFRNGTRWGPDINGNLMDLANITQENRCASPPLHKGSVEMMRTISSPAAFYQKGFYTLRVQLWAAGGKRMTDFEGTIYIEGQDEDYKG